MTDEQKKLGHAFFDGKVLQFRHHGDAWKDFTRLNLIPDVLNDGLEWRIKPDEPKKVKYLCLRERQTGLICMVEDDNKALTSPRFHRIPELDREVTLPEGE